MIPIGRAIHFSPSKKIVVKSKNVPRIGKKVFNNKKRFIGKVFDVFGPINCPYIEVDPKFSSLEFYKKNMDSMLFVNKHSILEKKNK